MLLLLSTILAGAAPIHIIAVHGPQSAGALKKLNAVPGATAIDASALHEYLLRTEGLLPMQDFDGFSAAPIKSWPPEAADIWKQGVAHCQTLLGPPPWPTTFGSALACANRLSVYLWQQYAAQQKAARVFEVDVSIDERKGKVNVRGSVWEPSSRDQLFLDETAPVAQLEQIVERVVAALIARQGKPQARNVISQLASALLGDPFVGQEKATTPVIFKKTCAAMPTKLVITPAGILADSLIARWTPMGATAAPLVCTLTFNEHTESGQGEVMTIMTTLLTCSSNIVTVELAKSVPGRRSTVDLVSERLVQGLATKLCK